jgi:hypothetical protein
MKQTKTLLCCLLTFICVQAFAQTPTDMPTGKKFYIQSAMNFGKNNGGYWDLPGVYQPSRAINKGANIQVWSLDAHHDRQFTLVKSNVNGYYEIQIGYTTNSRVDIQGRGTGNGTSVKIWDKNGQNNQKFLFHHLSDGRFKIYDRNSGKAICLAGRKNANGTNVHIWDDHNGPWMEWYLIDVKTKKAFIPGPIYITSTPPKVSSNNAIQNLDPNEELVYGKIGLNDNGTVKYTFAMTRKPNSNKQIYKREMDMPYGPQPIIGGGQMRANPNPKEYDLFDYYVVFNGQKIGPYDRIYDMHQEEGDIDKWITPDGKHISFAGVKGQKYFPVFGNKQHGVSFWSVMQAPNYDPSSSKTTYTMKWDVDDVRLVEDGSIKLKGWKELSNVKYSDDEKNLLYVGAQTEKNKKHIYLNHEPIDEPYYLVSQIGFLPGTNKPFYKAFNYITVDNASKTIHGVRIGDRKFDFTNNENIGKIEISDPWVSFTVGTKNTSYTGNDMYKKINVEIWEYNYRTDQLRKHGGYAYSAGINKAGNSFYYRTYDMEGNSILVAQGGKILEKISADKKGTNGVCMSQMSPKGDIFTYYKNATDAPYHLLKNGEPFTIQGVGKIMNVERFRFCPNTGKINLVNNKDKSVASEDRIVVNGDFQFNIKGRALANRMLFAEQSNDVITIFEFKRGDDRDFTMQIYKNDKPISDLLFYSVSQFCISPDASRYAGLVTQEKKDVFMGQYFTENKIMHQKRKLLVDGKIVEGNFGAPVWSKAKNKFLVLKQEGNSIRLVEL